MFYPQAVEYKAGWLSGLMAPGLASFYTGTPSPLKERPDNLPGPFTDMDQLLSGSFSYLPSNWHAAILLTPAHVCTGGSRRPRAWELQLFRVIQPLCSVHRRHYRPHGKTSQASLNSQLLVDMSFKMKIS